MRPSLMRLRLRFVYARCERGFAVSSLSLSSQSSVSSVITSESSRHRTAHIDRPLARSCCVLDDS